MPNEQMTLSRRDAKLGPGINCRTEKAGDSAGAKATDLTLSGIHLAPEELCAFLREPLAHKALFVTRAGSKLTDPLFKQIAPLQLVGKLDHAVVTLYTGLQGEEIKLGICKLARRTLEPKIGGMTELCCQVQATPTLDKRIAALLEAMSASVQVEITYEHNGEQPELQMGGRPKDDDDDDEDEDDKPAKGRRGRSSRSAPLNAR